MPIRLNQAQLSIKDENGRYIGINTIAEKLTAQQITDIQNTANEKKAEMQAIKSAMQAKGTALIPIYMGDYIGYDHGIQSMCVVGDKVYTANPYNGTKATDDKSDNGVLRVFDMTNNVELTSMTKIIEMGHANSMCYDYANEKFYIAPEFTYTSGTTQDAHWINKYDKNFNNIEHIPTPTLAQAVSYDPVTETLYYYGWSMNCYKWSGTEWVKVCDFDNTGIKSQITNGHNRFNQDFAVYNGRYYLTSAANNFISGVLTEEISVPTSSYVILDIESRTRFRLGETQGMEFTPDGHLFAGNAVGLLGNGTNSFVVELPIGTQVPYATNLRGNYDGYTQGQLTLSDSTVKAFALSVSHIRSLSQLYALSPQNMVTSVWIPAGSNIVENTPIRVSQDFIFEIGGHYTCEQFLIYGGHMSFAPMDDRSGDDWHVTITTTSYPIDLTRAGRVSFTGTHACRFNLPNRGTRSNFVYIQSYKNIVTTSYRPTNVQGLGILQAAGVNLGYDSIQFGGTSLPESYRTLTKHYTTNSYVLEENFNFKFSYTHGYAPAMMVINFELDQALPANTDVKIGEFEATLETPFTFNVASTLGGATIQVTVDTRCGITIRTSGTTNAGDSYITSVPLYISNDNW